MKTTRRLAEIPGSSGVMVEPPIGIEPMSYALRGGLLASTVARWIAPALLVGHLVPVGSKIVQGHR
jgi:hypothetical protein